MTYERVFVRDACGEEDSVKPNPANCGQLCVNLTNILTCSRRFTADCGWPGTSCLPYQSEECGGNWTRHETGYRNNVFIKDHLTLRTTTTGFRVAKTARNQAIRDQNSDIKDFHRGLWHLWRGKKKHLIHKVTRGKNEIKTWTNYSNITWSVKWWKKPLEPDRKKKKRLNGEH